MLLENITKNQAYVGYYGTAHKFVDNAMPIGFFFATSLYPMLSSYHKSGNKDVQRVFQRSLDLTLLIGFTVATFGVAFASPIIRILFGVPFVPADTALKLLSVAILANFMNRVVGYNLYAMGKQRVYILTGIFAVALNVGMNYLLIPRIFPPTACAIAKTVTETTVLAMALGYTMHLMKFRPSLRVPVLCILSGGATVGVVYILRTSPLYMQTIAAVTVYAAIILGTKAVTIQEIRSLMRKEVSV
jgi:O-antigen/teichoic acid export membrane protein